MEEEEQQDQSRIYCLCSRGEGKSSSEKKLRIEKWSEQEGGNQVALLGSTGVQKQSRDKPWWVFDYCTGLREWPDPGAETPWTSSQLLIQHSRGSQTFVSYSPPMIVKKIYTGV